METTRDSHVPPRRIDELAASVGFSGDEVEPCGWHKGKLALGVEDRLTDRPRGRYVNVTAINPTPFGEGKTVVAIGLAMGLNRIGRSTIVTLREPSQGPLFGIKGGGAGGGRSHLVPLDDINLHFTGDIHAVTAANNLLAAVVDNHLARAKSPRLDPDSVTWQRCVDVCDRSLRRVDTGHGDEKWVTRSTAFTLSAASELMAILALARNLPDLQARIGRIVVGFTPDQEPVTVAGLGVTDALTALLRDAIRPNLVQTCEGTPAFVHAGPFANIAHGNSSVIADLAAIRRTEFVVTESGFGAECGMEKFAHIKCRASGLTPDVEVLVCTIRALKLHSGQFSIRPGRPLPEGLFVEDLPALHSGAVNLQAHIEILKKFRLPVVVALNRFPEDRDSEIELVRQLALEFGADGFAETTCFVNGGAGAEELACAVVNASQRPARFRPLYEDSLPPAEKLNCIATQVYGADGVEFEERAEVQLERYESLGYGRLPICIAKTQYSLSHDPQQLGRPRGFFLPVREVRLAAGAGFLYALAGDIQTMPGLPTHPAAERFRVDRDGSISTNAAPKG